MLLRSYFSFWDDEAESETGGSEEDAPVDETPTEETVSSEEETPIADDPPGEEMAAVADAPPTEETFTAEPVASIDPVEAAVAASGRITYSVDGQSQELGSSTLVQTADGRVALATVNHVLQTEGGVLRDSEGAPRELGDQSGLSVEIQGSKFDLPVEGTTYISNMTIDAEGKYSTLGKEGAHQNADSMLIVLPDDYAQEMLNTTGLTIEKLPLYTEKALAKDSPAFLVGLPATTGDVDAPVVSPITVNATSSGGLVVSQEGPLESSNQGSQDKGSSGGGLFAVNPETGALEHYGVLSAATLETSENKYLIAGNKLPDVNQATDEGSFAGDFIQTGAHAPGYVPPPEISNNPARPEIPDNPDLVVTNYQVIDRNEVQRTISLLAEQRASDLENFLDTGKIEPSPQSAPQDGTLPIATVHISGMTRTLIPSLSQIAEAEGFSLVYSGESLPQEAQAASKIGFIRAPTNTWVEDDRQTKPGTDILMVTPQAIGSFAAVQMQDAVRYARNERMTELGVDAPKMSIVMSSVLAGRTDDGTDASRLPFVNAVATALASGQTPKFMMSLVDGGNALVGGSGDSSYVIVGKDSIEASKYLLKAQTGQTISEDQALKVIQADFGVNKVIAVEQPGDFHIDMRINLRPDGSVVLNDSRSAGAIERSSIQDQLAQGLISPAIAAAKMAYSQKNEDQNAAVEDAVVEQLKAQGISTIHRLPGVMEIAGRSYNFMNIEQGQSLVDGKNFAIALGGPPEIEKMISAKYQELGIDRIHFTDREKTPAFTRAMGAANCILKSEAPAPPKKS